MLQAFLDVVGPPGLKGLEIVTGVHRWETEVASLMDRHTAEINEQMETAIFINMLPRERQDVAMQMSCGKKLAYSGLRDHILAMANQKLRLTSQWIWGA